MRAKTLASAAAVVFGAVLTQPASAIVIGNGTSDSDYINLANSSAYSSVGQIYGADSGGAFAASGVLIAPGWVLTAAHVTSGATSLKFFLDGGGTNFTRPGGISADQVYTYSKWNGNLGSGYDIGLFHLSSDAPCMSAGTCAAAQLYTGKSEVNRTATMVGYGRTGTGATGATTFDGLKRAGQNIVDALYDTPGPTDRILLADFDSGLSADNNFGASAPLDLEALIAPGDSGGGLFEVIGGTNYLAGIASFGWGRLDGNPDSDYGDAAGWTRVSAFVSWIDGIVNGSSGGSNGKGKGQGPGVRATLVDVPEPAPFALLAGGLLLIFALRRKRGAVRA